MRLIILITLFSSIASASYVSEQEITLCQNDGAYTSYSKKDDCEIKSGGICYAFTDCSVSDFVDNIVVDITKGSSLECGDIMLEDQSVINNCEEKLSELTCGLGEEKKLSGSEVYCEKQLSRIDGKKLQESPTKKATIIAAKLAEKEAEDAKELSRKQSLQDLKELSPLPDPVGTTVSQLRAELKDAVNRTNKLRSILKDVIKDQ